VDSNGPEPNADNIHDDVELPGVDMADTIQHKQQNQAHKLLRLMISTPLNQIPLQSMNWPMRKQWQFQNHPFS
jgi:hypothetical protein